MASSLDSTRTFTAVDFDPFAAGDLLLTAPATAAQKEIWASVRLGDDANCAYNESQTLKLQGALDLTALQTALQALSDRHEALRTTLSPDGNHLCIADSRPLELTIFDLTDLDRAEQTRRIASCQQQAVQLPFDLEHGPLFRVELLKLQPQEHWLLLTAHHIICDGWSWGVLLPELGQLYSAYCRGETPDLEAPDRLSDYALQREAEADTPTAIATETYWLQQFATIPVALDLPTDRPRPAFRTFDADREDEDLSLDLITPLKQLGQATGCSFMTVLLASFEVFLQRLTGQAELVVGVPTAGQAATEQYNLVGHCVNLLPLRTQIDSNQSFREYLRSRRAPILDAYDHQQFTFGSLLTKLVLPRDPSRIPLVSVIFNLDQGLAAERLPFADLTVECGSNPRHYENFELYVNATEFQHKLTLEWQYNTNLFDAATIRRRIAEFVTLLHSIVANPDQPLARLALLPATEQHQLATWNQTAAPYPADASIQQLVEQQVAHIPDAIAVTFAGQSLTYQELNQRANQLAHHLRQLGVGEQGLVGLCLDRSLDLMVALLGILKAGAAYVPLDPTYPAERLAFMLADAGVQVLLTQQSLCSTLPAHTAQILCLDTDWAAIAAHSPANPAHHTRPDHLAYVIYTSGSTGQPKGVALTHRVLVNLLTWQLTQSPLPAGTKTLQFAPVSFDVSFQETFSTWCAGGTLVLMAEADRKDAIELLKLLNEQAIARLFLPFVALQQLAEVATSRGITCPALRQVMTAGEQLQITRAIADWFSQHPDCTLHNHYGPSETHVATAYTLTGNPDTWMTLPPIGRPLPNTQIYLLDAQQQQVPIGVAGELCISVDDPVRAYINRPDLTREQFIANPFQPDTPTRLYRTGDLARYQPDGNLEYLGRIDNQVKVRGFRIELGEVEAALSQCPVVQAAAVIVREDVPGDRRLVAYAVPHPNQPLTSTELRQFLQQKLPDYMLPMVFVLLDQLPLTPSGKVDRRALPLPAATRPDPQASYVAPRTAIEQQVADIWAQILQLEQVSIHDNFFELGGYSLLGTQVIARLRQTFAVEVPLRLLFESPTVATFTDRVETLRWATQAGQPIPVRTSVTYEEGEL